MTAAAAKSLQSCLTLCYPIGGSPQGSPAPGILQARIQEWVAISFSNAWKWKVKVKLLSCPTLNDPMDCSLPGSSVHGIFQARVLEWGAITVSRGSSRPRDRTQVFQIAGRFFTIRATVDSWALTICTIPSQPSFDTLSLSISYYSGYWRPGWE